MRWLSNCAKVIASHGHCVEWVSPLGLPVHQPYRKRVGFSVQGCAHHARSEGSSCMREAPALQEEHVVTTVLQRLKVMRDGEKMPVQKARQKTAFPPNYIHSLDSSHMMLTALACKREGESPFAPCCCPAHGSTGCPQLSACAGLVFAGVHDSFWTHAGDVPVLNRLLREAFVELHSRPLLEELLAGFKARYTDIDPAEFPPIPELGTLDLNQVLEAEYFFS